jgi:hypothetical protein
MRGYRKGRFTEGPYVDWLRTHIRDSRFEPIGSAQVTETGVLPEHESYEEPGLEHVVESYARGLSERGAWTLRYVATALASGVHLVEVIEGLLSDLADELSPFVGEQGRPQVIGTDLSSFEELFSDWLREAA